MTLTQQPNFRIYAFLFVAIPLIVRYNWRTTPCKFTVYNIVTCCMYIFQIYYHKKLVNTSITLRSCNFVSVCVIRTFIIYYLQFSSVQSLSRVWLFVTPWTAYQASLLITNSQSLLKLMSIESVMPSNYLILCHPLLLQPSIFPSIRVFSNESVLHIRWPKYWSFSFSISSYKEYSAVIFL